MTADCALSGEWENKGSWGTATSTYGNVVLIQNPIDDSLWQAVLRVDETVADKLDIALFRSVDVGESWNEIASWEFPGERRGWPSDAAWPRMERFSSCSVSTRWSMVRRPTAS
jgi:hypothetical protein